MSSSSSNNSYSYRPYRSYRKHAKVILLIICLCGSTFVHKNVFAYDQLSESGEINLVTENGEQSQQSFFYTPQEYGSFEFTIFFVQNITITYSFILSPDVDNQINRTGLDMLSVPLTISSSEPVNWNILVPFSRNRVDLDTVSFYHFSDTGEWTGISTTIQDPEFATTNQFLGNGTYVLLGSIEGRNISPLEAYIRIFGSYIIIGLIVLAIVLFVINQVKQQRRE